MRRPLLLALGTAAFIAACTASFDVTLPPDGDDDDDDDDGVSGAFALQVRTLPDGAVVSWTAFSTSGYQVQIELPSGPGPVVVTSATTATIGGFTPGVEAGVRVANNDGSIVSDEVRFTPIGRRHYRSKADWAWESDEVNAQAGATVATGDFDDDGAPDLAFGLVGADGAAFVDSGRVRIFSNSAGLPSSASGFEDVFDGASANARFGHALDVGDLDEDGIDDLVVGAPSASAGNGSVTLITGALGGPVAGDTLTGKAGELLGDDVDVVSPSFEDGDSGPDVFAGAPGVDLVYLLSADPFVELTSYAATNGTVHNPRHAACNVNGDTRDDLIRGLPGNAFFSWNFGSPSPPGPSGSLAMGTQQEGVIVVCVGDVSGDGIEDYLVGNAPAAGNRNSRLYLGSMMAPPSTPEGFTVTTLQDSIPVRNSIASADLDGDDVRDILVGDPVDETVRVFFGTIAGPSDSPEVTLTGPATSRFGGSVASADFDGDGSLEIVVGAEAFSDGQLSEGRVAIHRAILQGPAVMIDPATASAGAAPQIGGSFSDILTDEATCDWLYDGTTLSVACDPGPVTTALPPLPVGSHWIRLRVTTADGRRSEAGASLTVQ